MRNSTIFLIFALIVTSSAGRTHAQLSNAQLNKLKAATVYLRTSSGLGSGVLIERTSRSGLIVTADHVVGNQLPNSVVSVVFNGGTPRVREVAAEVVARNPFRDIAFLKVQDNNLPQPMRMAPEFELTETQGVFVAGYPNNDNAAPNVVPALSIAKNSITTIERTPMGFLTVMKLETPLVGGISGGAVVNSDNELIGIAVSEMIGAKFGLALPIAHAAWDIQGQSTIIFATQSPGDEKISLNIQVTDPKDLIDSVSFELGAAEDIKELPKLDTSTYNWPELTHRHKLSGERNKYDYTCTVKLPLSGVPRDETFAQAVVKHKDGSITRTPPIPAPMWFGKYDQQIADARRMLFNVIDTPLAKKANPEPARPALPAQAAAPGEATTLVLDKKSHFEQPSLTDVVRIEGRAMRRVLVGNVREASKLFWSADGSQLYIQGDQLLRVNYPQAEIVERFSLSTRAEFSVADNLLIAVGANNSLTLLDSKTLKVKNCWSMRQPFECHIAPGQPFALLTTTQPPYLKAFLCDLNKGIDAQELKFKVDNAELQPLMFAVSPVSNSILAMDNTSVHRFSYRDGVPEYVDSVRGMMTAPLISHKVLTGCTASCLGMVREDKNHYPIMSDVWIYVGDKAGENRTMIKDRATTILDDTKRNRVLIGGEAGLWEWRTDLRQLRSFPFPKSAPTVRSLALHPGGKVMAVLCNPSPGSADIQVYWIQLD